MQEAWLRWQRGAGEVLAPKSYLAQVVTRLAIDRLREVRRSREEYVGPWLPEPLVTAPGVLLFAGEALYAAVAVEAEGGQVQRVYSVSNPDKLARLG